MFLRSHPPTILYLAHAFAIRALPLDELVRAATDGDQWVAENFDERDLDEAGRAGLWHTRHARPDAVVAKLSRGGRLGSAFDPRAPWALRSGPLRFRAHVLGGTPKLFLTASGTALLVLGLEFGEGLTKLETLRAYVDALLRHSPIVGDGVPSSGRHLLEDAGAGVGARLWQVVRDTLPASVRAPGKPGSGQAHGFLLVSTDGLPPDEELEALRMGFRSFVPDADLLAPEQRSFEPSGAERVLVSRQCVSWVVHGTLDRFLESERSLRVRDVHVDRWAARVLCSHVLASAFDELTRARGAVTSAAKTRFDDARRLRACFGQSALAARSALVDRAGAALGLDRTLARLAEVVAPEPQGGASASSIELSLRDVEASTPAANVARGLRTPGHLLFPGQVDVTGRYVVDAYVSKGGLGQLWRGRSALLARRVALKVPLERDPRPIDDEGRLIALVQSAYVYSVYDVTRFPEPDSPEARVALVLEWLDGETLSAFVGRALPLPLRLRMLAGAARGLQAVHDVGLVHRDVKPENVFVVRRPTHHVKVIDLGIAKSIHAYFWEPGAGTVGYRAPEQLIGEPLTYAADQWGLAMVAVQLIAGKRSPRSEQRPEGGWLPMTAPEWERLAPIVERMTDIEPEKRFPTMSDVADAFEGVAEALESAAAPAALP